MSEKNLKALNKVLKTLSAVRTTLSDEERIILDQLILQSEPDDVASHSMMSGKAASKNLLLEEDDVSAHGMVSKSSSRQLLGSQLLLDDNGAYQAIMM
jgi:hypothetical protein